MNIKLFHFHLYYPIEEIAAATKVLEKLSQDRPNSSEGFGTGRLGLIRSVPAR